MRACRVHLSNGTSYVTSINGTDAEIQDYFLGQMLVFGDDRKEIHLICTGLDIWDQ